MEERNQKQRITQHLQSAEVQQRILRDMQRAREEATVTISNAASLFDFSENQLRDWEKTGLLNPQRRAQDAEQDGKGAKRRQYTTTELDKLAIIRELMNAGFSPGGIPAYVDELWASVAVKKEPTGNLLEIGKREVAHIHIDQRIERTEKEEFWHYFVSQALRLSLLLMCEDVPETVAGIILPLEKDTIAKIVLTPNDLQQAGFSLVGWLGKSRSFYTFLDTGPTFEHPSDFRVESLANLVGNFSAKQEPQNNIFVIVQRKAKPIIMSKEAVKTFQKILDLIYETANQWRPAFSSGVRDWMYQGTDFASSSAISDEVLNNLTNVIIQLGGKTADGRNRWCFCGILTPQDTSLPLQQRTLIVRAQSNEAPHNLATFSAKLPGLSFRAFQSGQIIYRSDISSKDFMIALHEHEESTRSAIAIPLEGEDGMAIGVIYLASDEPCAFSEDDQRVLRLIGRMIEELLLTYHVRQLGTGYLTSTITTPKIVDPSFKEFLSEGDFVNDVEAMLVGIFAKDKSEISPEEEISFIAVDIDNISSIATKYGDQVARNLSRAVGLRLQGQLRLFANLQHRRLYHVYADRFYLFLQDFSLDEARNRTSAFKKVLEGEYLIDVQRVSTGRPHSREDLLKVPDVTVRFGVTSYKATKLKEVLNRYSAETAIVQVAGLISESLEEELERGQQEGGSCIISWDPLIWDYTRWTPS